MENIQDFQLNLLLVGGIVCLFLALFIGLIQIQPRRKKLALLGVELITGILLLTDRHAYLFRGNTTTLGYWMTRICCAIGFLAMPAVLYAVNNYLTSLLMGKTKLIKVPKRIVSGFSLAVIDMAFVVFAIMTNMFYSFDMENKYRRGVLFPLAYVLPVVIIGMQISLVIQYRKLLSRQAFISILLFTLMPVAAAVGQIFFYGLSLMNLAIGISALILFLSALKEHNNKLVNAANTEAASGLPNAHGYMAAMEKKLANRELADYNAYYFDIVRMSRINRKYGSEKGDIAILEYSAYIKEHIEKDEVLGRLGGNYFVALIRKENTEKFLEMLKGVPVDIKVGDGVHREIISAVAGGYEITSKDVVAEKIIGSTSMAVSLAKNVYKRPFLFLTPDIQQEQSESRVLEEQIPVGLKKREFLPFYQPKVDSNTGRLIGAEALVRWIHDETVMPPYKFIPIMERNDSICDLDFYMLERVCEDIAGWLKQGIEVPRISVNFSRRNLGNPILAESIHNTIVKYKVPEKYVEVEITETLDEFPMSALKAVVSALQGYGIAVAIDDFGTGSSGINTLKEMEFDVLKIDKSFVDYHSERDLNLLMHIIEIAEDMDAEVIAEGVEQEEQIEILKKLGCHLIQGYFYDKPLSKNKFEERLHDRIYK